MSCALSVSFDPQILNFVELVPGKECQNRIQHQVCNWQAEPGGAFCRPCFTNQVIPDLNVAGNLEKWLRLEDSKRRLFYTLLRLGIPTAGIDFRFVATTANEPAMTGHCNGTITVNISEADPVSREQTKQNLNEKFRTLVGHFRHEFGHFFWEQRIRYNQTLLDEFRNLFGDERQDYSACISSHYSSGGVNSRDFVSSYASAHPWEDFAETFAHYLHLRDVLETAQAFGLTEEKKFEVESGIEEWITLSVALNEVNRSMGLQDLYPFAITHQVQTKLEFIHNSIFQTSS